MTICFVNISGTLMGNNRFGLFSIVELAFSEASVLEELETLPPKRRSLISGALTFGGEPNPALTHRAAKRGAVDHYHELKTASAE